MLGGIYIKDLKVENVEKENYIKKVSGALFQCRVTAVKWETEYNWRKIPRHYDIQQYKFEWIETDFSYLSTSIKLIDTPLFNPTIIEG
jgi:hypothetical protein